MYQLLMNVHLVIHYIDRFDSTGNYYNTHIHTATGPAATITAIHEGVEFFYQRVFPNHENIFSPNFAVTKSLPLEDEKTVVSKNYILWGNDCVNVTSEPGMRTIE